MPFQIGGSQHICKVFFSPSSLFLLREQSESEAYTKVHTAAHTYTYTVTEMTLVHMISH